MLVKLTTGFFTSSWGTCAEKSCKYQNLKKRKATDLVYYYFFSLSKVTNLRINDGNTKG